MHDRDSCDTRPLSARTCSGCDCRCQSNRRVPRYWLLRQERSVPQLSKIKTWLDAEQRLVLPRSPMAAAIGYTLNQWQALTVYTTQGYLAIDNNAAE
ncbi:MAG: transposase, partial [Planctomycetes bacterium]|nr:transposase [Planctomycetota bacterium]